MVSVLPWIGSILKQGAMLEAGVEAFRLQGTVFFCFPPSKYAWDCVVNPTDINEFLTITVQYI